MDVPPVSEQSRYQLRFDWAVGGAHAVAGDADVIVWVDALATDGEVPLAALPPRAAVIVSDFAAAAAAAAWVVELQHALQRRITIAVIAAGAARADGSLRFAVEDQLAAGAVIDRLAALGLDATSPEAAAAEGAYLHLARAVAHLLTASVSATTGTGSAPLTPAAFRIDDTRTAANVLVLRPHPGIH